MVRFALLGRRFNDALPPKGSKKDHFERRSPSVEEEVVVKTKPLVSSTDLMKESVPEKLGLLTKLAKILELCIPGMLRA